MPLAKARSLADRGGVEPAVRSAGRSGEAHATVLEVDEHLVRARLTHPEDELRAVRALAIASRHDPLPPCEFTCSRGCAGVVAKRGSDVLACLVGHLQLRVSDIGGRAEEEVAVGADLRVGEVLDAVITHAPGEFERRLESSVLGGDAGWHGGRSRRCRRDGLGSDCGIGLGIAAGAADQPGHEQQHDGRRTSSRRHTTNVRPSRRTTHRGDPSSIPDRPLRRPDPRQRRHRSARRHERPGPGLGVAFAGRELENPPSSGFTTVSASTSTSSPGTPTRSPTSASTLVGRRHAGASTHFSSNPPRTSSSSCVISPLLRPALRRAWSSEVPRGGGARPQAQRLRCRR